MGTGFTFRKVRPGALLLDRRPPRSLCLIGRLFDFQCRLLLLEDPYSIVEIKVRLRIERVDNSPIILL